MSPTFLARAPLIALLIAALAVACATVPITGRSQVLLFSDQQVARLADQQHAKFMAAAREKGVVVTPADASDARHLDSVNAVGRRLIDAAGLASQDRKSTRLNSSHT